MIQINDRYETKLEKHSNCLIIKKAKEEDLGKYTCQTNKNPTESADIELNGIFQTCFYNLYKILVVFMSTHLLVRINKL